MEGLRQSDLRAALDFLERIGGAGDLDAFAKTLVSALDSVIPADLVAYNEVDPARKRAFFIAEPAEAIFPGAREILERHMDENPLVVHTARTRDGRAVKWSDFISQRQLHATTLWNELFRPLSIERQMVAVLPAPDPLLVGIAVMRCGRDFSERDRALLNLLRPHLINAYRNAQARSVVAALESAADERGEAVVVLGALREPLALTSRARQLLAAFGDGAFGYLPDALLEWFRRTRGQAPLPPEPLLAARGSHIVEARFLTPTVIALRPLRDRLEHRALAPLGLTPRERDVLALVAEGYTNKQIAVRIDVEPATVKKHLERIYEKLGVNTALPPQPSPTGRRTRSRWSRVEWMGDLVPTCAPGAGRDGAACRGRLVRGRRSRNRCLADAHADSRS